MQPLNISKNILRITFFCFLFMQINLFSMESDELKKSIFQIKITTQSPNFMYPWQMKKPVNLEAVGILVGENKILTLASNLEYYTSIEVKKYSTVNPLPAKPIKIDYESNLAILSIEDDSYLEDVKQVTFLDKNDIGKQVSIVQTDNYGSLQTSKGRITNMDMDTYTMGHTELPFLNINSNEKLEGIGEIILESDKPSGILYRFSTNKNIGKGIPGFIINRFVETLSKKGSPFPHKGFRFRPLADDATREYYGLKKDQEGVLVAEILAYSGVESLLKINDIILEYGGYQIDSQGYFKHPDYGKQSLSFIAHSGFDLGFSKGSKVPTKILRDKMEISLKLPLKAFPQKSIKIPYMHSFGKLPNYSIRGGFLFTELSEFLLREWGQNWRGRVDKKLVYLVDYHKHHEMGGKGRILILLQVLPDEINNGYHSLGLEIIKSVEDKEVTSIKEMEATLRDSNSEILKIELDNGITIALAKENLKKADERISRKFNISRLGKF